MAINNTVNFGAPKVGMPSFGMKTTTPQLYTQKSAPVVQPAPTAPVAGVAPTQLGVAPTQTSGMGSYQGVQITPGSDADVARQIAAIDGRNQPAQVTQTQSQPVRGLFSDIKSSIPTTQQEPSLNYSGLVGGLVSRANTPNEQVTSSYDKTLSAAKNLANFRKSVADTSLGINTAPTSARVMQGRNQAIQLANAQKEAALASELGAYSDIYSSSLTGQGQQLSALGTAAGLAQPVQVPYGNQYINPLTGESVGGQGGAVSQNIPSLAQQVMNGQMSPSQAQDLLGNNIGLIGQLNQEILRVNPRFNFAQAEANTGVITGTLADNAKTAADIQRRAGTVTQHMAELSTIIGTLARTNFPLINSALNAYGSAVGDPELKALQTALSNVRGELAGIFAIGGTPTEGEEMARRILPDNITPAQLESALSTARQLMEDKVKQYSQVTTLPQYGQSTTGSGGLFDW